MSVLSWALRMLRARSRIDPASDVLGAATLGKAIPVALAGDTRGHAVPEAAIDLIARCEGFRAKAYRCPAGVWTIGYGTTRYEGGEPVSEGDTIAEPAARALMGKQAAEFARQVDKLVAVPLSAGERGALVSLAYNIGTGALRDSTLLRRLNGGWKADAAAEFARWNKSGTTVLSGLVTRRAAERRMFEGV